MQTHLPRRAREANAPECKQPHCACPCRGGLGAGLADLDVARAPLAFWPHDVAAGEAGSSIRGALAGRAARAHTRRRKLAGGTHGSYRLASLRGGVFDKPAAAHTIRPKRQAVAAGVAHHAVGGALAGRAVCAGTVGCVLAGRASGRRWLADL